MKEELDSLYKNNTWILKSKEKMQIGHQSLEGKWIYKINRDREEKMVRFKAH